jgi:hypothetical protein
MPASFAGTLVSDTRANRQDILRAAKCAASVQIHRDARTPSGQFRAELSQILTAAQGEKVAPEHKELVSVYFSDIVGFTSISATISSAKV